MWPFPFKGRGAFVGAANFIPECEILTIVVIKIQVMISVMGRTIDNVFQEIWHAVIAIVNRDCPDIDSNVETQVGHLVQRKEERIDVIGNTLQETIHGVEGVTCKRCSNLPAVMGLVQTLVHKFMMEEPVNPVNAHVGEEKEGEHAKDYTKPSIWRVFNVVIKPAVTSDLCKEECNCGDADPGK